VDDHPPCAADRFHGGHDQVLARRGQHLDRDVVGDAPLLDQRAHEVALGLGRARVADLDLPEAQADQEVEEAELPVLAHRVDQGLVAVAQIDAAPGGRALDHPARPLAVGQVDGRVGAVLALLGGGLAAHRRLSFLRLRSCRPARSSWHLRDAGPAHRGPEESTIRVALSTGSAASQVASPRSTKPPPAVSAGEGFASRLVRSRLCAPDPSRPAKEQAEEAEQPEPVGAHHHDAQEIRKAPPQVKRWTRLARGDCSGWASDGHRLPRTGHLDGCRWPPRLPRRRALEAWK
jgi:hypothetical protein